MAGGGYGGSWRLLWYGDGDCGYCVGGHGVERVRREMVFEFWIVLFFDLSTCLVEILPSKGGFLLTMVRFKSW